MAHKTPHRFANDGIGDAGTAPLASFLIGTHALSTWRGCSIMRCCTAAFCATCASAKISSRNRSINWRYLQVPPFFFANFECPQLPVCSPLFLPLLNGAAAAYKATEWKGHHMRKIQITRDTAETKITVDLNLDGTGQYDNKTGVGFFDHMLDQLARHALMDMTVRCDGDLHIDDHHTVEDVGIALGQALSQAMGDKRGIRRYGDCLLAMDDALVRCALDLSGRPFLVWNVDLPTQKIGSFDTELVHEFFQALSTHGGITLHVDQLHGLNSHHIAEATFKSVARALRDALETDPRKSDAIPSTKGKL